MGRVVVERVATPPLRVAVPTVALPLKNVTVPAGVVPEEALTVAFSVTAWPDFAGLGDTVSAVVVGGGSPSLVPFRCGGPSCGDASSLHVVSSRKEWQQCLVGPFKRSIAGMLNIDPQLARESVYVQSSEKIRRNRALGVPENLGAQEFLCEVGI